MSSHKRVRRKIEKTELEERVGVLRSILSPRPPINEDPSPGGPEWRELWDCLLKRTIPEDTDRETALLIVDYGSSIEARSGDYESAIRIIDAYIDYGKYVKTKELGVSAWLFRRMQYGILLGNMIDATIDCRTALCEYGRRLSPAMIRFGRILFASALELNPTIRNTPISEEVAAIYLMLRDETTELRSTDVARATGRNTDSILAEFRKIIR